MAKDGLGAVLTRPVRAAFTFLCFLVGLFAVNFVLWDILKDRRVTRWPTADGVVVASSWAVRPFASSDHNRKDRRLWVRYRYAVGDRTYSRDRLRVFPVWNPSPKALREAMKRYTRGRPVRVHYNPVDPHEAYVETGVPAGQVVVLVGGILAILMAVVWWTVGNLLFGED